ncbi:Long-chain-fatty-acid--CoA ligase [Methylobacterium crusticola]|uniref:Long-chain-fatty-acid--CoA ligase n=1 Tax=Methylobacterium crusticola TaxID=1697972 RepID=A0ABQ4R432_9HYPH|nr:AMP-binding protein [Methylobacterium crusticola]GJD51715.1 Long-chain-fatty-acid--CoA ligase [Methylobacterium crusticola]
MNIASVLANTARAQGDDPAVFLGERPVWTYREMARRAAALGGGFRRRFGVTRGDHVLLWGPNSPEYLEVMFAAWFAGAAIVPVNVALHQREVASIAENCGAKTCFVPMAKIGALEACMTSGPHVRILPLERTALHDLHGDECDHAEIDISDTAWIFYTSGTTGRPKGARLSHQSLLAMALAYLADVDFVSAQDSFFHLAPQSHAAGLLMLPHVMKGARNVVPDPAGFDPDEVCRLTRVFGSVTSFMSPTMLRRFIASPALDAHVIAGTRTILCGGAPLYVEDMKRALSVLGPKVWNGYGQGESPCTISALPKAWLADTSHPDFERRLASVGIARSGLEIAVWQEDGPPSRTGEGEIAVRGPIVMSGYWGNEEATAAAMRDGWLLTGDLGVIDADGLLTLKGRTKELIISGGSNIYPREVEEVLLRHPGVAEVAVIGAPDPKWGEKAVAYIVARDESEVTAADLDTLCLSNIARFKRPKEYRFVPTLPKNNAGKILRGEL